MKIILDDDAPLTDVVNTKEKTDDKENFESTEMWIEVDGTVKERVEIRLFHSSATLKILIFFMIRNFENPFIARKI